MSAVLFTGFPGFLGSALLPRTLRRDPDARAVALVQQRWLGRAREALADLERDDPDIAGRTDLVVGDITTPGLGLDPAVTDRLLGEQLEIFHLAAVYDLSVAPEIAWRVNVDGTRHVVDLARRAADGHGLRRLQYVSTCYVSGRYDGLFFEDDLELGQPFANHYDHTKHEAERIVAKARDAGLPVTIYRPLVVGDSTTGRTQKFDGPYYVLQLLLRQGSTAFMPLPRGADRVAFNLVPSDFVVDGIAALAGHDAAVGRTVALAQPHPPTVTQMSEAFAAQGGKRLRVVPMPTPLAAFSIDHVPGVGRLFQVPSSTLEYLTHPTLYDTAATTALLAEVGVSCPSFADHVGPMVEFFRAHPEVGSAAMV
ncbi:SDR family oxidoreductase [Actinomycetospora termitidis]|uniref:SDR family oxidoreductase n=1 Tax=Actinomycetospora termitidis TaxID=3053470 RepID=A0ABT7M534_9PSEU|nr:SDR family oxidoreductase [Actinomycetospora sp. Odt1-22]MDL5155799.1 SDR family oxidoreductase [Actinomycetospora sp. Odt1-22]